MAESMIERMARALYAAHPNEHDLWENVPLIRKRLTDDVRLVLAAMTEPTDAMLAAGLEVVNADEANPELMTSVAREVWRAMIGAADKEDKP